jgi:hypothetical protein
VETTGSGFPGDKHFKTQNQTTVSSNFEQEELHELFDAMQFIFRTWATQVLHLQLLMQTSQAPSAGFTPQWSEPVGADI